MLKMRRCLYTGREFKQNIAEKIDRKLVTLFTTMTCQFSDLKLTSLMADILYGHCPHDRHLCIRKILINSEMKYFQKCEFLQFFLTFQIELGSRQENYMCILIISFALFIAKNE